MRSDDDMAACITSNAAGWGWGYNNAMYFGWGGQAMSKSMQQILTGLGGGSFPTSGDMAVKQVVTWTKNGDVFSESLRNVTAADKIDPRAVYIYGPSTARAGVWGGIPAGLGTVETGKYPQPNYARLGKPFQNPDRSVTVMPYSEVCFLLAEAAQRGYAVGASAKSFYEAGIRSSFAYVGLNDENVISNYLKSTDLNSNGTSAAYDHTVGERNGQLEKIITQKYIAGYPDNGFEAWADHRRLHLPKLDPFAQPDPGTVKRPGVDVPDGFIKRIKYPVTEVDRNPSNFRAAVSRIGSDEVSTNVWWDKD
jgi:Susd and RagB outer membrane lipoprotein